MVVYRWELPADLEPLRAAAQRLAAREFDVVLFTSSIQLDHLLLIAKELGIEERVLKALREYTAIASVGPVMTSALESLSLPPDIIPLHPKMAALVKAASEMAHAALARKR
jgi:uroporphyrinogen-III synthase